LFESTFNLDVLKKPLGEKEYEWYEDLKEKDKDFRGKFHEIYNFMDGKRTAYEIAEAVSAEYRDTNLEQVLKVIHDLEKANFVSFQ